MYSASSLSLACLETVVHSSGEILYKQDYKGIIIEVPEIIATAVYWYKYSSWKLERKVAAKLHARYRRWMVCKTGNIGITGSFCSN